MATTSSHSRTTTTVATFTHTWSIENFNHWHLGDITKFSSDVFSPPEHPDVHFKFTVRYKPKSLTIDRERFRIYLEYINTKQLTFWQKNFSLLKPTQFAIKNFIIVENGEKHCIREIKVNVEDFKETVYIGEFFYVSKINEKPLESEKLFIYESNKNTIVIGCELTYVVQS